MDACANGVRFSLLYDGRCLTAEPGLGCGVALAACAAAGEANATLQTWRLEPNKNGTSFTVYSPAKSETTATPCPEDASPECPAWARLGECEKNAVYMTHACRRACGMCHPKPICSVWSHRTPVPGSAADSAELKLLVRAPKAPFLWLAPRGSEKRHLRVQLQAWSSMFPDYKLARVRCPGMAQAACCLEAGLWGLGHRNAHVQRASLQLCSYHESHMFPFQEWRVECAPDAAEGDAAEEQREGQPEPTAAWLEGLARDEGEEALERLLPHELLGVGEFSPAAFRRLGRHFHPDKSASPHSALLFDQLRAALDQFKSGSWRTAQDDDDRRRFFTDAAVVELNRTSHAAAAASEGPLWLAYYVLAARRLSQILGDRVRVGALRCGVPRKPGGWREACCSSGFALELGPSLPQPLLPELLVNFTLRAAADLRRQRAAAQRGKGLRQLTPAAAASADFVASPQLVLFTEPDCSLCDIARGAVALLGEARLINVSVVECPAAEPAEGGAASSPRETEPNDKEGGDEYWFSHEHFPDGGKQAAEHFAFTQARQQAQRDAEWYGEEEGRLAAAREERRAAAVRRVRQRRESSAKPNATALVAELHAAPADEFAPRLCELLSSGAKRAEVPAIRSLLELACAADAPRAAACAAAINGRDSSGATPLQWAAAAHPPERAADVVRLLTKHGASADGKGDDGLAPLHWAALLCQAEVVFALREAGASADLAAGKASSQLLDLRERRGDDAEEDTQNVRKSRRASSLFRVFGRNSCTSHVDFVRIYESLFDRPPPQAPASEERGRPPLALVFGLTSGLWQQPAKQAVGQELGRLLRAYPPLALGRVSGGTLLHALSRPLVMAEARYELLELLLRRGADPDAPNLHGATPLMVAVSLESMRSSGEEASRVAALLLRHGANVSRVVKKGGSALTGRSALDVATRSRRLARSQGRSLPVWSELVSGVRWAPEMRLYGPGKGLGLGLSLLGRPAGSEEELLSAIEGAKSMAHVLLDVATERALEQAEPPLEFEERDESAGGGATCGSAPMEPREPRPELDVPRVWSSMLEPPGGTAPSAPARLTSSPGKAPAKQGTPGAIKAGSKDPTKLRRGPAVGGGSAGPTAAIAG
ncbi:hypothetical protein EMIHUDRAFT_456958 [Emiliania huxleyi CCMP1516]|uniref:ShKT domain-containing protein n=2 Tax=Emiliania huxleyi TaxID=2903 RepID=A0A0D3JYQ3_EMIH1|nr:hypothetical protein EMIHUDRAFT_456958 [Emiliania huxleyi CCMP1516]EOD28638.1 hypothetical protein EMIHUDRAFT_456958 [Emiliania huxleyi CCMP1516]|eukprot:XP_005781067.1 hypothetical protein EMIHUDRAFT_456958 [Emiliania huxleyi CCMP1516]